MSATWRLSGCSSRCVSTERSSWSAGAVDETARRHAEHYAALSAQLSHQLNSVDEVDAAHRLDAARDNLRAAFAYAVWRQEEDLSLRIVVPLRGYTSSRMWAEPWSWCDTALEMPHSRAHPLYVGALLLSSVGAAQLLDHERSLALADTALTLVARGGVEWREAQVCRATALLFLRRVEEAVEAAAASVGDPPWHETGDLRRRAILILSRNIAGHPDEASAIQLLEDAMSSSPSDLATALHVAGVVARDPSIALERQRAAVDLARATGNRLIEGFAQASLAAMEARGDPAGSVRHYSEVLANFLRVGNRTHVREFARDRVTAARGMRVLAGRCRRRRRDSLIGDDREPPQGRSGPCHRELRAQPWVTAMRPRRRVVPC